jgi:hypothetical protein
MKAQAEAARLLRESNPVPDDVFAGAAGDSPGRATFERIISRPVQPPGVSGRSLRRGRRRLALRRPVAGVAAAAELEAMRPAARDRFVARTRSGWARGRWRLPVLAGGLTAAAAATAAAALVLTSGPAVPGHPTARHARMVVTAAWTVREGASGTVTVYLRQYANPAALQQTLQADGINAIVRRTVPGCMYAVTDRVPQSVAHAVLTIRGVTLPAFFIIHPAAMPPGSALFLAFQTAGNYAPPPTGNLPLKPWVLSNGTVPACVPNPPTKPAPTAAPKAP